MVSTPFLHLFSFFWGASPGVCAWTWISLCKVVVCCCLLSICFRSSWVVLQRFLLGVLFFLCRCSPCSLLPVPPLVAGRIPLGFCSPVGSSMCRLLVVLVFLLVQASMVLGCLGTVLLVLLLRILIVVVLSFACFLRVKWFFGFGMFSLLLASFISSCCFFGSFFSFFPLTVS